MAIKIIKKEEQASGAFAGGLILENKPIGFPQDGGEQKPYSNLFYWANAWSDKGGLIGEHPHKFFEIMSFVVEGEIEHYDNKHERWLSLNKGDAQIIRAGNGIVHAEKIKENSRMFQIWFDPNVQMTMSQPATYDDYKSDNMNYKEKDGLSYKNYVGNGGPIKMDSEDVEISEISFKKGVFNINLDTDKIYSIYILASKVEINGNNILEHDFLIAEEESQLTIKAQLEGKLFSIATPKKVSHKTYNELVRL